MAKSAGSVTGSRYGSAPRVMRYTKFMQAAFVQVSGFIALFFDKIDGLTYLGLSTLALGIYSTAEVIQKRNEGLAR